MKKLLWLLVASIGAAFATLSIASAQTYTSVDFPGAIATTLNGGPNPQGTSVGTETDAAGVIHGFTLSRMARSTCSTRRAPWLQLPTSSARRERSWVATSTQAASATALS